ncbi:hypothetical protein B0H14DRAFT_3497222 [Mycena olivaceomarginata]|nr:hypothetical protein B0H14DRAFT_3497222 [Mycena olivaceomarginata]
MMGKQRVEDGDINGCNEFEKFAPDLWQAHVVQRILKGYDSIVVAATGLGKSPIFEGTANRALRS